MKLVKPVPGPFSIVDDLSQRLLRRWVPKWYEAFCDGNGKLFYERLGRGFKPILTGRRRLLSQFRQLAMYSHAASRPESFLFAPDLKGHFEALVAAYAAPEQAGAWHFALDDAGTVVDSTRDLYGHAFVIFALSRYGLATGDPRARDHALATARFIDGHMRRGVETGFTEALDGAGKPADTPRRHESHMHLLEALLFAADIWPDPLFRTLADEVVGLFLSSFYNVKTNTLSEYFANDLRPLADPAKEAIICEPGHYYEWIWLLKKHARMVGTPQSVDPVCLAMLDWANTHGWDAQYGGIYDELDDTARVVADTKRLWPFTEALKANALMLDALKGTARDAAKDHMAVMTRLFRDKYMQERGFWTEWLNRDLTPAVDYMPATTPYHVYFGIMEARSILESRGASKSWRAGPRRVVYGTLRAASTLVRILRRGLARV